MNTEEKHLSDTLHSHIILYLVIYCHLTHGVELNC